MRLYIKIENGRPVGHPYFESNLLEAGIDPLEGYARFYRVASPEDLGHYEVAEVSYEWVDDAVSDVWTIREMSEEEKAVKRADMVRQINESVVQAKSHAMSELDAAQSDSDKAIWADFIAQLEAYECVDPDNPKLPPMPRKMADGTLVSGISAGTAPDVIS